jgi:hypothetical protein
MRNIDCSKLTAFVLCLSFMTSGAVASEEMHGEEEAEHKHVLGIFLGVTREESEDLETMGIEYAYRISRLWSVGALVERADREKDSTLILAVVTLRPYRGWFLSGGIGKKDPGDERETTTRIGIGYEFEFAGGWAIAPQVNKDFIENEEDEEVYGITFSKLF